MPCSGQGFVGDAHAREACGGECALQRGAREKPHLQRRAGAAVKDEIGEDSARGRPRCGFPAPGTAGARSVDSRAASGKCSTVSASSENGTEKISMPPGFSSRRALANARATGGATCSKTSLAMMKSRVRGAISGARRRCRAAARYGSRCWCSRASAPAGPRTLASRKARCRRGPARTRQRRAAPRSGRRARRSEDGRSRGSAPSSRSARTTASRAKATRARHGSAAPQRLQRNATRSARRRRARSIRCWRGLPARARGQSQGSSRERTSMERGSSETAISPRAISRADGGGGAAASAARARRACRSSSS